MLSPGEILEAIILRSLRNLFNPTRLLLLLALTLASCAPAPAVQANPAPTVTPSSQPSAAPSPTRAPTAAPFPSPTAAPTSVPAQVCSPLKGFTLEQIPALVTNPYNPPPPGSDDPHFGADLSDMVGGNRVAVAGREVQAAFSGRVSTVIHDRFPFGNALIVETPLDALPANLRSKLPASLSMPASPIHTNLTCPAFPTSSAWDVSHPSLYILYGHLESAPAHQPGDPLDCGQALGTVGQSGNALNPHLHFEARLGPGGAQLVSLSHYSNIATVEEMGAYCAWSVSGIFQSVDPLIVLSPQP